MDSFLVAIYGRKRTQKTSEEKLRRGADCCCKAEAEKWIYYNTQWWCSILKPIYADKSLFNSYGRKLKHNVALPFYFFSYSIFNLFCGRWRGICLQYHPFGSGYTRLVKGAWDRGAAAGKLYHQVVYLSLKERRGERERLLESERQKAIVIMVSACKRGSLLSWKTQSSPSLEIDELESWLESKEGRMPLFFPFFFHS